MRKLIYAINLTIDGCLDHTKVSGSDAILEYFGNLNRESGLLAFGRITYQLMVPYWPDIAKDPAGNSKADYEYAKSFESVDKIVFSSSLDRVGDAKTRLVRTDAGEEIRKLKGETGKDIVIGGVALASYLIGLGLVDEYIFVVHAVIAGEGRRLMEGVGLPDKLQLTLLESKNVGAGCVALRYGGR